jgi:hypothetical protein
VFEADLGRVGQMLILTAAANPEVRAARLDALGGSRNHAEKPGPREPLLDLSDFGLHYLAHRNERHEYYKILHARHALATESDVANGQDYLIAQCQAHFNRSLPLPLDPEVAVVVLFDHVRFQQRTE